MARVNEEYVTPEWLSANGIYNPFTNKKKWQIGCGACDGWWIDKIPVSEPSVAICPICGAKNRWSIEKWAKLFEDNND